MSFDHIVQQYCSTFYEKWSSAIEKIDVHNNEIRVKLNNSTILPEFCRSLKDIFDVRLATVICCDERKQKNEFTLRYVFSSNTDDVFVIITIAEKEESFPSLTKVFPSSILYEREINEMFGLCPHGIDIKKPLRLHDFPNTGFPLQKNFNSSSKITLEANHFEFTPVTGEGICEIPVGPIHAGIIEPGHFRFSVLGEEIIHLETRLGYTHKGIEKIAENMSIADAVLLAERISGDESVANSTAFCQAIEKASKLAISQRAEQIRLIFAELERVYNHFGTLSGMITDIGFPYGSSRLSILKEKIMQLNERLTGSRILFGVNQIGGVNVNITNEMLDDIHSTLDEAYQSFEKIFEQLKLKSSVVDRLRNVGIMERETARDLGIVGITARSIGIDNDVRKNHPYGYYTKIRNLTQKKSKDLMAYEVELQKRIGDVLSRFMIRVDDLMISKELIDNITDLEDDLDVPNYNEITPYSSGLGYVESHRGESIHWVMVGENNSIFRYKIRTASFSNWPIIEHASTNNIVPDFPVINKSLDLSYSGNDL